MRDSTVFYRSFYEAIKELPAENQARIYTAIFEYSLNMNEVDLSGVDRTIFTLIKPQLDANLKRYENGNKPKNKQVTSEQEAKHKQTGSKKKANRKQTESKPEANVNDNVNVNGNENENVNEKKSSSGKPDSLTFEFLEFYNKFLESKIGTTEQFSVAGRAGLSKIIAYLREQVGKKHPDADVETVANETINAWRWVLSNFDKWDKFYQGQLKLEQINSNLINIISNIKNGTTKNKRPADARSLAAEAVAISQQRNYGDENSGTSQG